MLFKKLSLLCISALISLTFISSVIAFPSEDDPDGTPPPVGDEGPEDGRWAPLTRWVIHPSTGMLTELVLIDEQPTKAYYEAKIAPTPPMVSACEVQPDLCVLERN